MITVQCSGHPPGEMTDRWCDIILGDCGKPHTFDKVPEGFVWEEIRVFRSWSEMWRYVEIRFGYFG